MEINNDVNLLLLDQLNNSKQSSIVKTVSNPISNVLSNENSANQTKTSTISDTASISTSAIDNLYSMTQENAIYGLDLIEATGNALDEMSNNLSFLRSVLNDSENYGDEAGVLAWLEEQSNAIIDQLLNIYQNTEYNGVKVFSGLADYSSSAMLDNYQNFVLSLGTQNDINAQLIINTKINLEGLQEIKGVSIYDDEYESKISSIISNINSKIDELNSKKQTLNDIIQTFYEENENNSENQTVISSNDIQLQIIGNAETTLDSTTQGLSSDILLQFLNN